MVTHSRGRPPLPAAHEERGVLAHSPSASPSLSHLQPRPWRRLGRRGSGFGHVGSTVLSVPCAVPPTR